MLKLTGEAHYGYSEDDEMQDHALDELLAAFESHDHKKMMSALMALVEIIKNKEESSDAQPHEA